MKISLGNLTRNYLIFNILENRCPAYEDKNIKRRFYDLYEKISNDVNDYRSMLIETRSRLVNQVIIIKTFIDKIASKKILTTIYFNRKHIRKLEKLLS